MKKLIILGSSRGDGNTKKITDYLRTQQDIDIINLQDYNISYFDYEHKNRNDDFIPLMKKIIANYDILAIHASTHLGGILHDPTRIFLPIAAIGRLYCATELGGAAPPVFTRAPCIICDVVTCTPYQT